MLYAKRQLETVEAVRYTGNMDSDMIEMLSDKNGLFYFDYNDLYIYNKFNKPHLVQEGEMIVCYRNGLLDAVDYEEFTSTYKEVKLCK